MIPKRHSPGRPAARLAALADRIASHPYVPVIRERAEQYAMRLDKPVGIFLLLWPTLWALWIAGLGRPDAGVVVVFVLGVVLMRSAGEADRLIIGIVVVGFQARLGLAYHLGVTVAAGLCAYHQYLIRDRDGEACLRAFRRSHWLGAAVFAGIWADFFLRG